MGIILNQNVASRVILYVTESTDKQMKMDDDADIREQIFHNTVRENIVSWQLGLRSILVFLGLVNTAVLFLSYS